MRQEVFGSSLNGCRELVEMQIMFVAVKGDSLNVDLLLRVLNRYGSLPPILTRMSRCLLCWAGAGMLVLKYFKKF